MSMKTLVISTDMPDAVAQAVAVLAAGGLVAFIGGTRSAEIRQAGLAATRALAHDRLSWVEGSHLFPMERPLDTAQAVLRLLVAPATAQ